MATMPSPNDLTRQQLDELDALLQRMLSLPLNKPEPPAPAVSYSPPLPEMPPAPTRPAAGWRTDPASVVKTPYLSSTTVAHDPVAAVAITPSFTPIAAPAGPRQVAPAPQPMPMPASLLSVPLHEKQAIGTTMPDYAGTGTLRGVDAPATPDGFRSVFAGAPPAQDPFPSLPTLFDRHSSSVMVPPPDVSFGVPTKTQEPATRSVPVVLWPLWLCNAILEWMLGWLGPIGVGMTHPATKTLLGCVGVVMLLSAGYWSAKGLGWFR